MATNNSGVMICAKNKFKVGATEEAAVMPADMNTMNVEFTTKEIAWNPHDTNGRTKRIDVLTDIIFTGSGMRNVGDEGNDFIADMATESGSDREGYAEATMPDGKVIKLYNAVYEVSNVGTGAAVDGTPIEWKIKSNGTWDIIPAGATE